MSSIRQNHMVTITNDENYDLAGHMARLADSANVVIPVANQTERDTLTAVNGMVVLRLDTGAFEARLSGVWVPVTQATGASPYRMHADLATLAIGAASAGTTQTIVFGSAFDVAPIVTCSIATLVGSGASKLIVHGASITTTQFSCQLQTNDNSAVGSAYNITVAWTAVQMTPTSAGG